MVTLSDFFPLIKAPAGLPVVVVATTAMLALAAVDLLGAVFAKEWAESGTARALVLGLGSFALLFWIYASSLRYAELSVVTMGWVVILQVGLLMIDRMRYGVELPPGKWVAVAVVLIAQGYLVLAPTTSA